MSRFMIKYVLLVMSLVTGTLPMALSPPLPVVPAHMEVNSDRGHVNHSFVVNFVTIFFK